MADKCWVRRIGRPSVLGPFTQYELFEKLMDDSVSLATFEYLDYSEGQDPQVAAQSRNWLPLSSLVPAGEVRWGKLSRWPALEILIQGI